MCCKTGYDRRCVSVCVSGCVRGAEACVVNEGMI